MPTKTVLVNDKRLQNKINRLADKYNLSGMVRYELVRRFGNNKKNEKINIKKRQGRRGGMLYGNTMKIYIDEMTARLLDQVRKREKKFNFSEFCREVFEKFEED